MDREGSFQDGPSGVEGPAAACTVLPRVGFLTSPSLLVPT